MNDNHLDINDDEIRVISPLYNDNVPVRRRRRLSDVSLILLIVAACLIIAGIVYLVTHSRSASENDMDIVTADAAADSVSVVTYYLEEFEIPLAPVVSSGNGYVEHYDTIVGGAPLSVFIPRDAIPYLSIGVETLRDSDAVMVVQAADIRRDNGKIVGSYVVDGKLVGHGQSKSGYCAIISGNVIIGVADSTPYLEQAIDKDGYFFRQYPLVVAGQVVDNKQEWSSLRKALVDWKGTIAVVMTREPMTMNDFSSTLASMGVTNAIYLVGSTAYGFARERDGRLITFGTKSRRPPHYTNYMVWK